MRLKKKQDKHTARNIRNVLLALIGVGGVVLIFRWILSPN